LARYQQEVAAMPEYQAKLAELERAGSSVAADEQDLNLASIIQIQSRTHQLQIVNQRESRSSTTQTNQFFDEKTITISYEADTEQLVNFLTSLTSTNSLIRVRDLTVRPKPPINPSTLNGQIVLVASYQKKKPVRAASASERKAVATVNR